MDIHPAAASWPVPCLCVAVVFWLLDSRSPGSHFGRAQPIVVLFGVLGIIVSFFSGYRASEYADVTFVYPEEAISVHHLWGKVTLFASLVLGVLSWIAPRARANHRGWRVAVLISLLVTLGFAAMTSWRGGKAVFEHGAGVRAPIKAIRE